FLLPSDFLDAIEVFLSFLLIQFRSLSPHQAVDLRLPGCFRGLLSRIPLVVFRRTQPDIHLLAGIKSNIHRAEQASLIIKRAGDAFDERREVESDNVELNANARKVLLNHGGHALAILVAGVGDHRKLNGVSVFIAQRAILHPEAVLLEPFHGRLLIERMRLQPGVEPELIPWRYRACGRTSVSAKDDAGEILTVD